MSKSLFFSLCFLLIILMNSCYRMPYLPKRHKKNYTYCYQDKNTGIDSLININGYYEIGRTEGGVYGYGSHIFKIDTSFTAFMFFNNGIFLTNIGDVYNCSIPKYFEQVAKNSEQGKKDLFYQEFDWGCYVISGDTIKTQYINHPSIGSPVWMLFEQWFKAINRNTLKSIYLQSLYGDKKALYDFRKNEGNTYTWYDKTNRLYPAKFISVPELPNSNCWLKKKKWFWCDESKYKEWIDKQNLK